MRRTWMLAALMTAALALPAMADVSFTTKPTITRQGGGAKISFAVSAATDVEVAILDGQGRVVRHLAAGLLGPKAPAPLRADSLAQELLWDGNDDAGNAAAGPVKVRVSAGVAPKLDKNVGWDGNTLGAINSLAVGKDGEVYVLLSDAFRGRSDMRVLDKNGKYLRTIMPYPANTPKERTATVGQLEIEGERLPIVFNGTGHTLSPMTAGMKTQNMAFSPKGHLVMASAVGSMNEQAPVRHMLAMDPRGGAPEGVNFVGPEIRKGTPNMIGGDGEASTRWFDHVAVSPDGGTIYLTTFSDSRYWKARNGVWRMKWSDKESGPLFLGQDAPGADDAHFNDPAGLATDKAGNLYVCDRGNNRVMVFAPEGNYKLLGKFAVDSPEQIAVHPTTGEIYVLSHKLADKRTRMPTTLLKFSAFAGGAAKELARLAGQTLGVMALDPTAAPAKLWLTAEAIAPPDPTSPTGKGKVVGPRTLLVPVADAGDKFQFGAPVNNDNGLAYPMYLAGDAARNRVLLYQSGTSVSSLDLNSGKLQPFAKGTDVALDTAGNVYVTDGYGSGNKLSKYDPAGKPLPFQGSDSNKITVTRYRGYGPNLGFQGLAVRPNGDIYFWGSDNYGGPGNYGGRVCVYGPDGKEKAKDIVNGIGYGDCGLGVDAAGNMYMGINLKPVDQPYPAPFMGKLPPKGWTWWRFDRDGPRDVPWVYTYYNSYLFHWGSVMKFGPKGGAFYGQHPWNMKKDSAYLKGGAEPLAVDLLDKAPADAVTLRSSYLNFDVKVAGMLWRYPGCGIIPSSGDGLMPDPGCACYNSHLTADAYGRVFAPDVFRFSVEMLDTNGNQVARIGRYGNPDATDGIPLAWPAFVSVSGDYVYISDSVNRRVTVVKLAYQAQETVPVQ